MNMIKDPFFTDTHIHPLLVNAFIKDKNNSDGKIIEIIEEYLKKYVKKMIFVSTEVNDCIEYNILCQNFPTCFFSAGIHPCDVKKNNIAELNEITRKYVYEKNKKLIAIGEIGLDFHHESDENTKKIQIEYFHAQIELALSFNLPIIIHSRKALQETYEILNIYKNKNLTGSIHCFNADQEWAKKFIDLGFVLGVGAYITYPANKELREVVKFLNSEGVVLETDAPFLPLQHERGQINTPHSIPVINKFIADLCGIDEILCGEMIEKNVTKTFGI